MFSTDENNYFPLPRFAIGVKDFSIVLKLPCQELGHCLVDLCISLELEGDFLSAAVNDELNSTVDYDKLCKLLTVELLKLDCQTIISALTILKEATLQFSPLIKGGSLMLSGKRHQVSFKNVCLL